MKYIDFGLYEYLIIKMLDDCHKYSSLPEVNFFYYYYYEDKSVGGDIF